MTLPVQFLTLATMILNGILFGACFDSYNYFLKRATRQKWFNFLTDSLFGGCLAVLIFYILFQANNGEIRFYLFLALLCGFSAYQALLRTLYFRLLKLFIHIVVETYLFLKKLVQNLLIRPIQSILVFIATVLLFLFRLLAKIGKLIFQIAKFLLKQVLSIITLLLRPLFWLLGKILKIIPSRFTSQINQILLKWKQAGAKWTERISEKWNKWTKKKQ